MAFSLNYDISLKMAIFNTKLRRDGLCLHLGDQRQLS
jgi:hypothetical protein